MSGNKLIDNEREQVLLTELDKLRSKLQEADDTLEAIRTGSVDALTIQGPGGPQIFTLQSADHRYRILIEEMNEGAITLNKEAIILYSNSQFAQFIGLPLEKIMGSSFYNYLNSSDHKRFQELFNNGWEGKSKGEFPIIKSDGKVMPFSISMNPLETEDVPALGMIVTDLSAEAEIQKIKNRVKEQNILLSNQQEELKQEKLIRESIEHMRFLAEAMPEKVWTATSGGQIDYVNNRWMEYTGLKEEDFANEGWRKTVHPDDLRGTLKSWSQSLATGEKAKIEHRFKRSDGVYRWHQTRAVAQKDSEGKIIMWVGINSDIQDQMEYIESLAQAKQNLNNINVELTHKNDQLIRTNNDLDTFIYTASHDLKAPVSNIEGLISMLESLLKEEGMMKGEIEGVIEMMSHSVAKFKTTIIELTEISKIQKNIQEDIESVSCSHLIEDVMDSIRKMIIDSNATVHVETKDCPRISFSRKNLKSIIYNLLSNAIKYKAAERDPEVFIEAKKIDNYSLLTVRDNGLGIDANEKNKIFSMFKRLHDHVEGTGVGLYIVKRIVDNAGGKIEVDSEVGKGTTFKIYLKDVLREIK